MFGRHFFFFYKISLAFYFFKKFFAAFLLIFLVSLFFFASIAQKYNGLIYHLILLHTSIPKLIYDYSLTAKTHCAAHVYRLVFEGLTVMRVHRVRAFVLRNTNTV